MTNICTKEVVSTRYAIALKDKVLLDIMRKDNNVEKGHELWEALGEIQGVRGDDYDGAFGNYIYIEIDIEYDTEDTWKLIYDLINQYLPVDWCRWLRETKDKMTDLEKGLCSIKEELRATDKGYNMTPELQNVHTSLHKLINIVRKIVNKEGEV